MVNNYIYLYLYSVQTTIFGGLISFFTVSNDYFSGLRMVGGMTCLDFLRN